MGKGNKGGGGGGAKNGITFSAAHTTQNDNSLGEKVLGIACDSIGVMFATFISTVLFTFGAGKLQNRRKASGNSNPLDSIPQALKYGIGKAIESVADDQGRQLTRADFNLVKKAWLTFGDNAEGANMKEVEPAIREMLAVTTYTPDVSDDSDSDDEE